MGILYTELAGNKHVMNFDLLISSFFGPRIQHLRTGTKGPCGSRRVPSHRLKLGCYLCRVPTKCLNSHQPPHVFLGVGVFNIWTGGSELQRFSKRWRGSAVSWCFSSIRRNWSSPRPTWMCNLIQFTPRSFLVHHHIIIFLLNWQFGGRLSRMFSQTHLISFDFQFAALRWTMISQECTFIREQFLENAPRHGWLLGKEVLFFRGETKLSLVLMWFPKTAALPSCPGGGLAERSRPVEVWWLWRCHFHLPWPQKDRAAWRRLQDFSGDGPEPNPKGLAGTTAATQVCDSSLTFHGSRRQAFAKMFIPLGCESESEIGRMPVYPSNLI